jgi:diaminopimelate epimerase
MKSIKFWKMSGSGNDFVMIDNRRRIIAGHYGTWAKRLCHRQFGVGADGLLLLERDSHLDFRMVYYNADGSRADMCGNGARCMAYFARAHNVVRDRFTFRTDAFPVGATLRGRVVRVSLADAHHYKPDVSARVADKIYHMAFLNTGVPHAVLFVPDLDKIDVEYLGRSLRSHRVFGTKGSNVNFVQKIGPHRLRVRTYERGVEGETLACGTGVTASAITAVYKGLVRPPVSCVVVGGDTLKVHFRCSLKTGHSPVATDVTLQGPVRVTFKGEFYV